MQSVMALEALIDFPFKYGFGIILLLNCAKRPACSWRECVADPARRGADVAQSAEHPPCKRAVIGSIPIVGFARKKIVDQVNVVNYFVKI
jgi:hypothetical protein